MENSASDIVTISGISHAGKGVGRINGKVVFVEGALPDEIVRVEIIKESKKFCESKIANFIKKSINRIDNDCPSYGECGGCAYRHVEYSEEVKLKTRVVKETLAKIAGVNGDIISDCIPSAKFELYRNKMQYHTGVSNGQKRLGFIGRSFAFLPIIDCKLADPEITAWAKIIEKNLPNEVTRVVIRKSSPQGKLLCLFVSTIKLSFTEQQINMMMSFPKAAALFGNVSNANTEDVLGDITYKIVGEDYLVEEIKGLSFAVGPTAFFQVNPYQIDNLYSEALQFLPNVDTLLDLYCGVGTITLCSASVVKKVFGVEINKEAISYAKKNASLNEIANAEFYALNAADIAKVLNKDFSAIIVDPPRAGCSKEVLDFIASKTKQIIYVSCESSTLARDIKVLKTFGFEVASVIPIDMFPRTAHVECVVLMSRVTS